MATTFTVYVPTSKLGIGEPYVRDAISTARWIAGGMSVAEIAGHWIGSDGLVIEPISKVSYIVTESPDSPKFRTLSDAINRIVDTLKDSGEESVLVEVTQSDVTFR